MLRPWINENLLDNTGLCFNKNPQVATLLETRADAKIEWRVLCQNPHAVPLLKKCLDTHLLWVYIYWSNICKNINPDIFPLLEAHFDKIDWVILSKNPAALPFLKKHPEKIYWPGFCGIENPDILPLLEQNLHRIEWWQLSRNPVAAPLLAKHLDKIDWSTLCYNSNPAILPLLEQHPEKLDWNNLCKNPIATPLLLKYYTRIDYYYLCQNTDKRVLSHLAAGCWTEWFFCGLLSWMDWHSLSRNPIAVPLLEKYPQKIVWSMLCCNPNPDVLPLMEKYPDKIEWEYLSSSPHVFPLLDKHPHLAVNLDWKRFSANPGIFMTYDDLRRRIAPFKQDLLQQALHPRRIHRILSMADEDADLDIIL